MAENERARRARREDERTEDPPAGEFESCRLILSSEQRQRILDSEKDGLKVAASSQRVSCLRSNSEPDRDHSREHHLTLQRTPHHFQNELLHLSHVLQDMTRLATSSLGIANLTLQHRAAQQPAPRCRSSQPTHRRSRIEETDVNSLSIAFESNDERSGEGEGGEGETEREGHELG